MDIIHYFNTVPEFLLILHDLIYGTTYGPIPGLSTTYTCTRRVPGTFGNWIHVRSTLFSQRFWDDANRVYDYTPSNAIVQLYWVRLIPASTIVDACYWCAQSRLIQEHFPYFSTGKYMFPCLISHYKCSDNLVPIKLSQTFHQRWDSSIPPEMPNEYIELLYQIWF
jgi:hypothetical protein